MLAPQVAEMLLNGARFEVHGMHEMGERFGVVSTKVMLSGARWRAGLSGVELLIFLDRVETYGKRIT